MQKKIKVLFLDIGGVLLTNGWPHESRQAAAKLFGFDYETMNDLHKKAFPVWEEGRMSMDDYLDSVLFYEPRSFIKDDMKTFMFQQSVPLPQTMSLFLEWKQSQIGKLKIYSLNNEPKELNDYRINTFGLHRLFDHFISSCDVHLRKPDPLIYRTALNIASVSLEECIYIDDRENLIAAAKALGFRATVHHTFEETRDFLEAL